MSANSRIQTFAAAAFVFQLYSAGWAAATGQAPERPEERASVCVAEGKIRFALASGDFEIRKSAYCTNTGHWVLISQSCIRDLVECRKAIRRHAEASARESLLGAERVQFGGDYGTPGFKLCRDLGGSPRFLEFFDAGAWHSTDACFFGATGLYLSAERLYAWFKSER